MAILQIYMEQKEFDELKAAKLKTAYHWKEFVMQLVEVKRK